ncbi:MAG TPA: hypothetical protein VHO25_12260 [Polyangiaceae bacterium]|nr:hypothetical protein [Polyangiaceae bacterium]
MGWWAAALIGALILYLVAAVLTLWLLRHVWKRRKRVSALTKVLAGLLIVTVVLGPIGGVLGILKGLDALGGEGVDPSQKARVLGEGIAQFMNCSALALLIWLPAFVVAFNLMRRGRKPAA